MTDQEAEAYHWRNKGKPDAAPIVLPSADVARVEVESAHTSLSPEFIEKKTTTRKFIAKVTFRVVTKRTLSSAEVETLAASVRDQAARFHVVGVRFSKQLDESVRRDTASNKFYAWLLFWDGKETTRNFLATADQQSQVETAVTKFLLPNERVVGTWADANAFPGVFVLSVHGDRLWSRQTYTDGSGGTDRERLGEVSASKGTRRWIALYREGQLGTFKADGNGTDKLAVELHGETLHVFADESEPWFVGSAVGGAVDLAIIPIAKKKSSRARFRAAGKPITSASEMATCASSAGDVTDQQVAYRKCFTRADIIKLGFADNAAGSAFASCEYQKSKAAQAAVLAALIADEDALLKGRVAWYERPEANFAPPRGGPKAPAYCAELLSRFGPNGKELSGVIEPK